MPPTQLLPATFMKYLSLTLVVCVLMSCGQNKSASLSKPEKYVSLMCETGDITLTLNPDNTFDMIILYWSQQARKHVGQERVTGTWLKSDKDLILKTDDQNEIKYTL